MRQLPHRNPSLGEGNQEWYGRAVKTIERSLVRISPSSSFEDGTLRVFLVPRIRRKAEIPRATDIKKRKKEKKNKTG